MFLDSKIAESYQEQQTKVKYVLQFDTVPYIRKKLLVEVKDQAFCFKFDESTTEQEEKKYNAYSTYYSLCQKERLTFYYGSLFIDHCAAEDLIKHFYEFMGRYVSNVRILLNIGMDGPSVNKKFKRKLLESLAKNESENFIFIGTYSLLITNNAFGEGMTTLREVVNLDPFVTDLHVFFKDTNREKAP